MPFLRLSRDQRGYENTFLLHAARPGDRLEVLYWYRSAPGVRVGRAALDEDAIRAIEEQHPEIEFDWPRIFEEANTLPAEIERRPERARRKPARSGEEGVPSAVEPAPPAPPPTAEPTVSSESAAPVVRPPQPRAARNPLLDELVGREIASRLRARFEDIQSRLDRIAIDDVVRKAWEQRASALNPDGWATPQEILDGVQGADRLFDELRREMLMTE